MTKKSGSSAQEGKPQMATQKAQSALRGAGPRTEQTVILARYESALRICWVLTAAVSSAPAVAHLSLSRARNAPWFCQGDKATDSFRWMPVPD